MTAMSLSDQADLSEHAGDLPRSVSTTTSFPVTKTYTVEQFHIKTVKYRIVS